VWDQVQQRADAAKEKEYQVQIKKKDEYDALMAKVQEMKTSIIYLMTSVIQPT
jgi:hypothetical protein